MQVGSNNTQVNNFYAPVPVAAVSGQVVIGAIPARPPSFQPRTALMEALAEVAGSDRVAVVCALTGQRGVGKTQLAAAYARRRIEQKCPLVAWVDAERSDSILAGLDALASALGLRREGEDAASGVARLLAELQARVEPALVVFDNVTDSDDLAGYLPATGATQIILTSTQQTVRNLGQAVPIDVYTPEEAIAFLREATGHNDEAGAGALAAELGRLPLALAHAAAVICNREITYPDCVRLIRDYPLPRYLVHQPGQHYPHGTAEAILLSLHDAGVDTDPEIGGLAGVLAVLSPEGVPRALLTALTDGDTTALDDQIQCLAGGSVITHTAGRTALRMHQLVARVIRELYRAEDIYPVLISTTATMLGTVVFPEALAWQRRQDGDRLIAQIDTLWEHSDLTTRPPPLPLPDEVVEQLVSLRIWSVRQLTQSANLDRAITLATTVHTDCQWLLGEEHPDTLIANNLAYAYESAGRLEQAIPLYERTLTDRRRLLGEEHPDTLRSANNLAGAYQEAGRLDQAIALYKQTLTDYRRLLGEEHPETLTSANNLAGAYRAAGRLDQAIPLFERTLTDRRRLLGEEHPDTLTSASNLAVAYESAGRLEQAIPLYEQTLTDCRRVLGEEHPFSQAVVANLQRARTATGGPPRRRWWRT